MHGLALGNWFSGMLLRTTFYAYCQKTFPNFSADLAIYGTWKYFETRFQMDEAGQVKGTPEAEEQQGEGEEEDAPDVSAFRSKPVLLRLLNDVAKGKHDINFASSAKEQGRQLVLNFSCRHLKPLHDKLDVIEQLYAQDFPVVKQPEAFTVGIVGGSSFVVQKEGGIRTKEEYDSKFAEWQKACQDHEENEVKSFIADRVHLVVSDMEGSAMIKKLQPLNVLREGVCKGFVQDTLCTDPLSWDKIIQKKRSFTHHAKVTLGEDSFDLSLIHI